MSIEAYIWVSNEVAITDRQGKCVLSRIAWHANDEGLALVSLKSLSDATGKSINTVRKHIETLVSANKLEAYRCTGEQGKRLADGYRIVGFVEKPEDLARAFGFGCELAIQKEFESDSSHCTYQPLTLDTLDAATDISISATDTSHTLMSATDISATDISPTLDAATDISATDMSATDISLTPDPSQMSALELVEHYKQQMEAPQEGQDPSIIPELVSIWNAHCGALPKVEQPSDYVVDALGRMVGGMGIEKAKKKLELATLELARFPHPSFNLDYALKNKKYETLGAKYAKRLREQRFREAA